MIPITESITEQKDTRTKEEKMDEVNAILRMVAKNKGCKVSDLEWKRDKYSAIHIRRKDGQETNNQES